MNGLCGKDEFHESPLIGMGTDSIEGVYPHPGLAEPVGPADGPGREGPNPDDDGWRVLDNGVDQASMRRKRGKARLAIDESRFVILRAKKGWDTEEEVVVKRQPCDP